jgi:hypothetical protein
MYLYPAMVRILNGKLLLLLTAAIAVVTRNLTCYWCASSNQNPTTVMPWLSLTAGTYTITYQICEKLNTANCDTATVTVPAAAVAVIDAVNDKSCFY